MEERIARETKMRQLHVITMSVQLTVSGGNMISGLHVQSPAEVVKSLAQEQKSNKYLMVGKSVKEKQLIPLHVITIPVQSIVSGGHMMNGLHVPKHAEVVKSHAQEQK